jgi:O-antigen/teichoic acid export membrane protein
VRIARAAAWTAVGQAAVQIPWFGSLIVLAALVSPAAFGTVSAGLALVGVALLLVGAGTRGELVAAQRLTGADIRRAIVRTTITAALLAVAMAAAAPLLVDTIARGGDVDVLRWLAASIAVYGVAVVPLALMQRELRTKRQAAVMSAGALCGAVASIVSGALGAGVWALVVRQVATNVVVAGLAWLAFAWLVRRRRPAEPPAAAPAPPGSRAADTTNRRWFSLLAAVSFLALNLDYYLVGLICDVKTLGPYALAFMIAFAPVTQISWQLGKVLFPAAASTTALSAVGARTAEAISGCALVLAPLVPAALVLAPWIFPTMLGDDWRPLVLPFQLLLVAGTVHALANLVGESLSGTGDVALHTRCYLGLLGGLAVLLPVLIAIDGARGAAIAHLIVVVPFATVYLTVGARRIGTSPGAIWRRVSPLAAAVAVQVTVTLATLALMRAGGAGEAFRATASALTGLAAFAAVTVARPPHVLARVTASMGLARRAPA